ncbi:MAG: hypothetical protein WD648_04295 [Planctomycetaceae bacterium]
MPGLTRKCREGEAFRVGEATIRVVRTGRKAVINIIAPPDVRIEHVAADGNAVSGVPGVTRPACPQVDDSGGEPIGSTPATLDA